MKEIEKKRVNANNESGAPKKAHHHSGIPHPQEEKVVDAKHNPEPRKRALNFRERSQAGYAEKEGGGIKK